MSGFLPLLLVPGVRLLRAEEGGQPPGEDGWAAAMAELCKHLLAVYLSQVTRTCQQLSVSDKQLTDILSAEKTQEA